MKAVLYDKKNSPDVLKICEVPKPVPNENEVLIKIHAAAVNAADYRAMKLGIIPKSKIFGADIAGQIEALGENVKMFKVGDAVFGDIASCGYGGFAEYVAVPEYAVTKMPSGISFETAAAIPMSSLTALQALRNKGGIKPGQKVLICGASGGVGTCAIQLTKHFRAKVTAVCSSNNMDIVKSLNPDHIINYMKKDFFNDGLKYDLILAVNGNHPLSSYKRILAEKGTLVVIGGALSQVIKAMLFGPLLSTRGKKLCILTAKQNPDDLEYIAKLAAEGELRPVIDRYYNLDETAEAVNYLSKGHAKGKVVIKVQKA